MEKISNKQLFEQAKKLSKQRQITPEGSLGYAATALVTEKNKIYTGISFSGVCGLGFCAEVGAILEMLKNNETKIKKIITVSNDSKLMPPCGRCRELMFQINRKNLNTEIILKDKIIKLKNLLPERWQELWE